MKKLNALILTALMSLTCAASAVSVSAAAEEAEALPLTEYWSEDSSVAENLRNYVDKVTNEDDPDNFIPKEDRIAVFDMDGTLICETYYTYYDTMMYIDYCNGAIADSEWLSEKDKAELKAVADEITPEYKAGVELAMDFARAFSGMTVDEFYDYVVEFGKKKTASFNNMRYIDCFYLPMVELVKYLYDNDFTVYVVSGTERTTTRAIIANSPIKDYVTPAHVIGTEFEIKLKGHEHTYLNMDYKYGEDGVDDPLVITGGFIQKNLNANKTIFIEREIGQRPVLAFGNSGSDTSMMNYAIINNEYPAEAYMIIADDTEREWGNEDWAESSAKYEAMGYVPVSMKDDFAEIYPEGITKAEVQYHPVSNETGEEVAEAAAETAEAAEAEAAAADKPEEVAAESGEEAKEEVKKDKKKSKGLLRSIFVFFGSEDGTFGELVNNFGFDKVYDSFTDEYGNIELNKIFASAEDAYETYTDGEGHIDIDRILYSIGDYLDGSEDEEAAATEEAEDSEGAEVIDISGLLKEAEKAVTDFAYATVFPSWNPDSPSLHALVEFVSESTDITSPKYIEPADRIATFDMDGTILSEKAPVYVDYCLTMHRVLDDPTYKATEEEKDAAQQIRDVAYSEGKTFHPDTITRKELTAISFEGMTPKEFRSYVKNFADTVNVVGFDGMTYGESFYKPMIEVIDFLKANDFDVWIVSGCEREIVRGFLERYDFPYDHIIGTDVPYVPTGIGENDAPDKYNISQDEEVVLGSPAAQYENTHSNKPSSILREIGKRPVLAFGNSSGDYSMLNFAKDNKDHEGMGFLVVCDDTVREYGSDEKAAEYYDEAEKQGWTAISMANDWTTIYGENVKKTSLPGAAKAAEEVVEEAAASVSEDVISEAAAA